MWTYVVTVFAALSRLLNAITGGPATMTFSSRMGWGQRRGCRACKVVCKILTFIFRDGPDHCEVAINYDREKAFEELDRS